ncbi:murein transglycosylase A [Sphingomonas sp. 1P06PA]|uniref:murein transglycosylase A n=1 Tax=Sphingomonas sp. 1P06PA TaxID=554121 RepID=UPI0039A4619C
MLAACVPASRPAISPPPASPAVPTVPPAVVPATAEVSGDVDNARGAGIRPGPAIASLAIDDAGARRALAAFRISCPALQRRNDASGLTRGPDWQPACAAALSWPDSDARGFFARHFETAIVGDGQGFATGYYEPEIEGSRVRAPGYDVPVYARPADIVEVDLGQFSEALKGKSVRGRVSANRLIPYYERREIVGGALAGRGLELAWARDPIEFFFLQVQGSGRLRLPDGQVMRIGYAGQNGRDYTGIGKWMKDQGMLQPGQSSMQGIMLVLRAQPDGGASVMDVNKSFVFFKELTGPGPLGALGLPVTPRGTVAADPAFVPLGAPVFLDLDRAEADGLWIAQDTGGAIKGANRFDTFWGAGAEARTIAGGMSGRGQAYLLLPIGSLARLQGAADGGTTPRP